MKEEILRMEDVCIGAYKPYALDDFRLNMYKGEIVSLIGLSGAGKTALYNYFLGNSSLISGRVFFGRKGHDEGRTFQGVNNIVCIGQQSTLISKLSVMENLFVIAGKKRPKGFVRYKDIYHRAKILFGQLGISIDPRRKVQELSKAECHLIELARAVENESLLVVIDDVFQSYGQNELSSLINLLLEMKTRGISVLYLCHQIDFMKTITRRFVILRKGRTIRTFYQEDFDQELIHRLLVGNEIPPVRKRKSYMEKETVFEMQKIQGPHYVYDFSVKVKKGEIKGFYDLENKGNKEIMDIVIGEVETRKGTMVLNERIYKPTNLEDAIMHNVGFIPRDMVDVSLVNSMSFQDNLFLPVMKKTSRFKILSNISVLNFLEKEYMKELGISLKNKDKPVRNFDAYVYNSILLKRWLLFKPDLLVCIEPFSKADIIMKDIIYTILSEIAETGTAILISSSDMRELKDICDSVITLKST